MGPMIFCLFKVIFYRFYHGKLRLHYHLGNIFVIFPATEQANLRDVETSFRFHWGLVFFFSKENHAETGPIAQEDFFSYFQGPNRSWTLGEFAFTILTHADVDLLW